MIEAIAYSLILAGSLVVAYGLLHVLLRDRIAIAKLMDAHYARKQTITAWMPESVPAIEERAYKEGWP